MAKKEDVIEIPPEKQLWQVHFGKDGVFNGHGQQVEALTEEDARAQMARIYGEDYPILKITPL